MGDSREPSELAADPSKFVCHSQSSIEFPLQVSVRADGPTRVISVSDVSMHQWEDRESASNASRTEAIGPTEVTFEVVLKLAGIGVSVIDTAPQVRDLGDIGVIIKIYQKNWVINRAWLKLGNKRNKRIFQ